MPARYLNGALRLDLEAIPLRHGNVSRETYQQVWVDIESSPKSGSSIGYVHADFYNGAFSTTQCEILLQAIQWTLSVPNLKAIVMLGGPGYFSNGIALNVIEGSDDPSAEGWANINAIDDCVQALLAPKGIVTFAAMRGNAAAGGLAMATAADFVVCAEAAVLTRTTAASVCSGPSGTLIRGTSVAVRVSLPSLLARCFR